MNHEWLQSEQAAESIVLMLVMASCFGAGVAFAAYRAIGWETKIRTWAHGLDLPELVTLATVSTEALNDALGDLLLEEQTEPESEKTRC